MKVRFQADANLKQSIVRGCLRVAPGMDFKRASESRLDGLSDMRVLQLSSRDDRLLVTHDVRTMPAHFSLFLTSGANSPGVLLIPQQVPIHNAIEELVLIWAASDSNEWQNRLVWLPL